MRLNGKTVIITGASSGIGAAAARLFAAEGAAVILGARRVERLAAIAAEIEAAGGAVAFQATDVTDDAQVDALVDLALESFGRLDAAFNNAGATGALSPAPEMATQTWRAALDVNLTSAFFAARRQIPAIKAAGGGSIVFTSSFVGPCAGLPGMAAYAAAKAGLVGLTHALAAEHGADGVRVNALLPGGVLTEMAGEDPNFLAWVRSIHALKRMATPEEIAEAALFLLSDAASFVTGAAIRADGGVSITKT